MVLGLLDELQIFSQLYLITRAFNRSGATRAVAFDISKTFERVWHADLLHKLKSYGMSGQIFGLISSFLSNRRLRVILDVRTTRNIHLMREFLKAPFLVLRFSYYTLMTFLTMLSVILLSMLMILLSILRVIRHLIFGNNFNWLLNLNLIYETLWPRVRCGLLISMLEKLSWFRLAGLITMVLLISKWNGLFLRKNHFFRCGGWSSLLNWIGSLTLSLLLKLLERKLEFWFILWNSFLLRLLSISINLPYAHVWNTVARPGLVPLVATWNC